jgi:hypothetical protein
MSAVQVNYPSTTLHLEDPSANYVEVAPLNVKLVSGEIPNNVLIAFDLITMEADVANRNTRIAPMSITCQDNTTQNILSTDDGLFLYDGSADKIVKLKATGLLSTYASMDISCNALTLDGVASSVGQVVMADASGAPYWASLPAEVITTLAQVLTAGADASFNTITSIGGLELQVSQEVLADPVVVSSDASGALVISSATPANLVDATLATKQFSGSYLKVVLNGAECYLPIFSVPPP